MILPENAKLSYPQLGSYDIPIGFFVREGLGLQYISPPSMTQRTIEIGAKLSPDYVCAPFKCMIGCYVEAMEKGANILISTGGTCRLGYYGELHEKILRDAGYRFDMLRLNLQRQKNIPGLLKEIRRVAPHAGYAKMGKVLPATYKMLTSIDKIEDYMRKNMGFEDIDGSHEKVYKLFLRDMRHAKNINDVNAGYRKAMNAFRRLPSHKPEHPIRVGVVGEYFTIMDPESNHRVEAKIAKMGAEVHRWMNLSNSVAICPDKNTLKKLDSWLKYNLHHFPSSLWVDSQIRAIREYTAFDTGASGISTAALASAYAKAGFDGLIHVKSFGCMPEMDIIPILHNISADHRIPVLYLSYDTQTSDTGIETRLEAFYDMISMRSASQSV